MGGDEHRTGNDANPTEDGPVDHRHESDTLDTIFFALRNRDRRYALYFLLEHETVRIDELADVVTGWTRATAHGTASRQLRDRVLLDLRHRHLPRLSEAGLVHTDGVSVTLDANEPAESIVRRSCATELSKGRGS